MALGDFTRHQQGIIKRYYASSDSILLQKLGEQVTELYLAEGKKKEKMWATVAASMLKLGVPQSRIDHIVQQSDPKLVANIVTELQSKS